MLKPSSVETVTPNGASCRNGTAAALRFLAITVILSLVMSVAALSVVSLPWWKIFRRCVSVAAALSLFVCLYRIDRKKISWCGLTWGADSLREFRLGALLGLAALAALLCLGLWAEVCHIQPTSDQARLWRTVIGFIPAAVLVGILEELVFRGYLFQHLRACSTWSAVLLTSILYSVVHTKTLLWDEAVFRELIGLFLLGVSLSLSRLWTGHLWLAIGLHAVVAYGARVNKLLVPIIHETPDWLVGTSRLINGVACWGVIGIVTAAMWALTRRTAGSNKVGSLHGN